MENMTQEEFEEIQRREDEIREQCIALVEHLVEGLAPLKVHLREFMTIEELPEPLFRTATKIWNACDRAQETLKKEMA